MKGLPSELAPASLGSRLRQKLRLAGTSPFRCLTFSLSPFFVMLSVSVHVVLLPYFLLQSELEGLGIFLKDLGRNQMFQQPPPQKPGSRPLRPK